MAENKQRFAGFIGPSYTSRSERFDCQRLVNMYLEMDDLGAGKGQEPAVAIGTPGLEFLQTIGTGPIRCTYTQSDDQISYIVSGNEVYQITGGQGMPLLIAGNLTTSIGPVQATDNGFQVIFVDGINGYYLEIGATGFSASTPIYYGGGNGTISSVTVNPLTAVVQSWLLTAITSTTFSVVGSITGAEATLNTGALYTCSQFSLTITAGSIPFAAGEQYRFDVRGSNSLNQITDPNFYPTDTITFQDGYFIGVQKGTQGFFISNLNDVSFPVLNEAYAQGSPDILIAAISNNRQLYLLGAKSLEIWWDSGASGSSPFQRQDGRFSQVGCIAPASVAVLGETFFWLGGNAQGGGVVYMLDNAMPTRVSTHAIEYILQNAGNLAQATAYSYQQEGHYFYALNVPSLDTTLVLDMTTKQWAERQSQENGFIGRHLAQTHCFLNNDHIIGDYRNGNIYRYNLDVYTDNFNRIPRIRQCPHLSNSLNMTFFKLLEVDFQFGVGLDNTMYGGIATPGSDPKVWVQWSNDGGQTWGNSITASLGKIGKYKTRARWRRLGNSRDRVFRVITDEPVRVNMLSAYLDFEVGNA